MSTTTDATAQKLQSHKAANGARTGATHLIRARHWRNHRLRCDFSRHRRGGGTVMRHFIGHAGPVTALAPGMVEAPARAGLIALSGSTQTGLARTNRTPFRTVSVTPITVRADHHAFAAGHTKILSSSDVHGSVPWRARQGAALRDTLRMQRPCRHCQVTGRDIGKRPNFTAMSRLLLSTGRCHCARSPSCRTASIPSKPTKAHELTRTTRRQRCVTSCCARRRVSWSTEKNRKPQRPELSSTPQRRQITAFLSSRSQPG